MLAVEFNTEWDYAILGFFGPNTHQFRWFEPIPQPYPGGGTISPIAVPTPNGVVVYQRGEMFRFVTDGPNAKGARWDRIKLGGTERPRQHEHMAIVYNGKRDRLVFLSEKKDQTPELWFFSMKEETLASKSTSRIGRRGFT